jgi:aminoglycoside phosphotransferase (APT) family kinase protein
VLVHGDLHARHVLVGEGRVTGVIDWGDVCVADRAVDLSLVWSFLPPAARPAFFEVYGPIDKAQELRARALALSLGSALALYGRAEGLAALERECVDGLERTLQD